MPPVTDPHILPFAILYLGLIFLLGYLVNCLIFEPGRRHWIELVSTSYAAGAGVLAFLLFAISIIGFKPSRPVLVVIAIITLVTAFALLRKGRLLRLTVPGPRHKIDPLSLLGIVGLALITAAICNISAHTAWPGLQDIDAIGIWMFKAKVVAIDALRPIPPALRDPILSYSHQDYPLSMPLVVAGLYAAIGHIDDSVPKLLLMPAWAALAGIVYSAIRRMHRRATSLAITAIFCTAPTLISNAAVLVAETPLLVALAGTVTQLMIWLEEKDQSAAEEGNLILAGLFAAIAAFTKNEGLALLPAVGIAALIVALLRRGLALFYRAAIVCAIAIGPWLVYRLFLPRTHEDYGSKLLQPSIFFSNLSSRSDIFTQFVLRLFDVTRVGMIWWVLLGTTLISPRALLRTSVRALWCILLIQLSLYVATFIVTPWDVQVLIPMITPKLQTQASAVAALLIALNLRDLRWPGQTNGA